MNTERRKVCIYKHQHIEGQAAWGKVCTGIGVFLGFGVDYEELSWGAGVFSTAIIELPDGSVRNVPVEMIVFNN